MMPTPTDMLILGMTLAFLACLRRRRCGGDEAATRREQNEILMNVEVERKPQA
jgi:hypothetical protein